MGRIVLIIVAITSFSSLFVLTAIFLLKAKMILVLIPVVVIFTAAFVGTGIFLLNSKALSSDEKEILRKFLFFLSPEYGWGSNNFGVEGNKSYWLIYVITMLLVGIVVGLFVLLR